MGWRRWLERLDPTWQSWGERRGRPNPALSCCAALRGNAEQATVALARPQTPTAHVSHLTSHVPCAVESSPGLHLDFLDFLDFLDSLEHTANCGILTARQPVYAASGTT
jgi:hypothetical protein